MVGESGASSTGARHYYYACAVRKKSHKCKKKNEKKDFLEWYIVEQVVEYVLTPSRIDLIAGRVVEEYNRDFDASEIKELESRLREIDRDLEAVTDTLIKTTARGVLDKLNKRAEALTAQKETAEVELAKLRIASRIKITEEEVSAWLRRFCTGDLMDEAFRRRIIDVFINAVYLYDDKVVMYFNIRDGRQVSYIEMLDMTEEPGADGDARDVRVSDSLVHQTVHNSNVSYIFVGGHFGIIVYR